MNDIVPLMLVFAALAVVAFFAIAWQFRRSRSLLENWAAENGYRLVSTQRRSLLRGPFIWTTTKGQSVYRVTVEDAAGAVRSGWLRCGSWWGGLLSDSVQVRWDDQV